MTTCADSRILQTPHDAEAPLPVEQHSVSTASATPVNKATRRAVIWAAFAVLTYFAITQVSRWPGRLRYPGEEDAAEGTQLSEMVHLRQGLQIYRAPSNGEFDSAIYGPLCYLLGAAVVDPTKPAYLPLRLLSLFATLALAAVAAYFVFKLTRSRLGGALAAVLLLSTVFIGRYGISVRADMVALLLSFSGFVVFYRNRESRRAMLGAAALMLLSFFYKQQFIGAPVAIVSYLLITKRIRRAFEFALTIATGGIALVFIFSHLVFAHQAFLTHFFSYNRLPFEKGYVLPEILMFAVPLFIPLLGAADYLDRRPDKLIACYFVTSVAGYFLLLLSSGSGADTNRCLEAAVVISCLFAARIVTSKTLLGGLAWTTVLAATLAFVSLLSSAFVVRKITAEDFTADAALQKYLKRDFPPRTSVLGYYAGDPLRAGLTAPITNLWHYSALIRTGALSDRDIVNRIDDGGYGAILLDFNLHGVISTRTADFYTTPSIRNAIAAKYQLVAQLNMPAPELTRYSDGNIYIWIPRVSANSTRGHN